MPRDLRSFLPSIVPAVLGVVLVGVFGYWFIGHAGTFCTAHPDGCRALLGIKSYLKWALPQHVFYVFAVIPGAVALANHWLALRPRYEQLREFTQELLADPDIRARYPSLDGQDKRNLYGPRWEYTLIGAVLLVVTFAIPAAISERAVDTEIGMGIPEWSRPAPPKTDGTPAPDSQGTPGSRHEATAAMLFAGYGAYVFTITRIISRINSSALSAKFLMTSALRATATMTLGFVVGQIGFFTAVGGPSQTLFLYFALGLFPNWALGALQQRAKQFFKPDEDGCEVLPLCLIDGLDDGILDHLAEYGTWDVQHLATSDPIALARRTLYPMYRIVDWMQQAILIVYVRRAIPLFRRHGIRGAIDMAGLYGDLAGQLAAPAPERAERQARAAKVIEGLAAEAKMSPEDLTSIAHSLYEDALVELLWKLWFGRTSYSPIESAIIAAAIESAHQLQVTFVLPPSRTNPIEPPVFTQAEFREAFQRQLTLRLSERGYRWTASPETVSAVSTWKDLLTRVQEGLERVPEPAAP